MLPTILIGTLFAVLIVFAGWRTYKSLRDNKCPGCTGGCVGGHCSVRKKMEE